MTGKQRGQIFSLDFIIALTLVTITIGMTLHFYELSVYEQKETTTRTELNLIGLTASSILLNNSPCETTNEVTDMGYEITGCAYFSGISAMTKSDLMIPDGINCFISVGGSAIIPECNTDAPAGTKEISVTQRTFLHAQNQITMTEHENCLSGGNCGIYTSQDMVVKIWR